MDDFLTDELETLMDGHELRELFEEFLWVGLPQKLVQSDTIYYLDSPLTINQIATLPREWRPLVLPILRTVNFEPILSGSVVCPHDVRSK